MSTQPDGMNDAITRDFQAILGIAARLGEGLARQRAESKREQLMAEQNRRKQLEERFEAERSVMRSDLQPVDHDQFWEAAKPLDVAQHYATAREWENHDDVARDAREKIETEVKERFGMDVNEYIGKPSEQPDQARALSAEAEQVESEREHTEANRLAGGVAEGNAENDRATDEALQEAASMWDSGDRRAALAEALTSSLGDSPEAKDGIMARMTAELDQGTAPASAARAPGKTPRARKGVGQGLGAERSREL